MQGYRHFASMARGMDVHFELIDARECALRHLLILTDNLLGGQRDPLAGDVDPAQLCEGVGAARAQSGAKSIATRR